MPTRSRIQKTSRKKRACWKFATEEERIKAKKEKRRRHYMKYRAIALRQAAMRRAKAKLLKFFEKNPDICPARNTV